MADSWEEIKKLAADFQRTQTSDTLQRLSERNCIDLIKLLTDKKLIELIHSKDGKDFITPSHLKREIEDEIYVNGGRMQIHDLANNLNVDYNHIDHLAKEIIKEKPDEYNVILGQIIHSTYKTTLGKQIQDTMMISGQLSIADFSKSLDLPSEFLLTIVKELLPTVLDDFVVSQDERTFYTTDMMDRYKSIIAGTLSAISKPVSVASLMKRVDIPERIFMPIVEGLIKEGRIDASVENRQFIPAIYAREQNEWINKFYSSNSYIEYDVLSRMDIKQPKTFLKKRFPDGTTLKTCFVSPDLVSQVESLVEDTIASNSWIDISSIISSAIEADDVEQLLQDIFKKNKQLSSSCLVIHQVNLCSIGYITNCKQDFNESMRTKAQEHLNNGKLVQYFLGGKLKEEKSPRDAVKENENPDVDSAKTERTNDADTVGKIADVENKPTVQPDEESKQSLGKDARRDKKDKKSKVEDFDDSDDEPSGKKSKSRKSGGGAQGREIKQKAVKKKYVPGNKNNPKANDDSDEESMPTKTSRSNKGRAARRAISPERPPPSSSTKQQKNAPVKEKVTQKEPLVFMEANEMAKKLRIQSSGDGTEELFESIAEMIKDELNQKYEKIAKETLDEYLKSQSEETEEIVS